MGRRLVTVLVMVLAAAGCKSPPDRLITADGQVVTGRLESLAEGAARISGVTLEVPRGNARVWARNGASLLGTVTVQNRTLTVTMPGGGLEMPLSDVSMILWGETAAESRVFDVPSEAGWVCTHVVVGRGDPLTVSAGGAVMTEAGVSGPDGTEKFSSSTALIPHAVGGSLVMRIGSEGVPIQVGASWTGTAPSDGAIYLAVNTLFEGAGTARGHYTAVLTAGTSPGRGMTAVLPGTRRRVSL